TFTSSAAGASKNVAATAADSASGVSSDDGESVGADAKKKFIVAVDTGNTTEPLRRGQPKTGYDLARKRLDKLMSKPEEQVQLPGPKREHRPREPWQFVRNIRGSSAGVGSGDFDIYRGIRRREFERREYMDRKDAEAQAEKEFEERVSAKQAELEEKQAKKRAKRAKKKAKAKQAKGKQPRLGDNAAAASAGAGSSYGSEDESGDDNAK
ncbi:hypothetical protein BOX15_Mlig001386g2, partial [Macrostomum lignano]